MNYGELFIGTALGWFVSFVQNCLQDRQQKTLQLEQLRKIMEFNVERMTQMLEQLTKARPELPDYRLDLTVVDFLISNGERIFRTTCEFKAYNWRRYQMHHINCELDMLFNLQGDDRFDDYRTKVLNHIHGEIRGTKKVLSGGCNCG